MSHLPFSPAIQSVIEEFIPICRRLAGDQRYAISVGGSLGKGTWDEKSDIDFRLFTDQEVPTDDQHHYLWEEMFAATHSYKTRGILVDGIWPRTVSEVDQGLDGWLSGQIQPEAMDWTIWGYHLLTDIHNQSIIEDPYGIIAAWKERLKVYPPGLKKAILMKYSATLRYWRTDYHYAHKLARRDLVFLASMTSRLVHEILQVLYALNETYFPGDGSNLTLAKDFKIVPDNLSAKIQQILYPQTTDILSSQYNDLMALIDEVILLANQ